VRALSSTGLSSRCICSRCCQGVGLSPAIPESMRHAPTRRHQQHRQSANVNSHIRIAIRRDQRQRFLVGQFRQSQGFPEQQHFGAKPCASRRADLGGPQRGRRSEPPRALLHAIIVPLMHAAGEAGKPAAEGATPVIAQAPDRRVHTLWRDRLP